MSSGRNSRFAARKLNVGDLNDNAKAKWQAECDAPWPAAVNQLQELALLFACWQGLVRARVFMTSKAELVLCLRSNWKGYFVIVKWRQVWRLFHVFMAFALRGCELGAH